jgi:hypothetical protein
MRCSRLLAFASVLVLASAPAFAADDGSDPKPTACPAHREAFKTLDEHMVDAERLLGQGKLDEASLRQKQILEDLDKLSKMHRGEGG